jgi:peptidoglycan/xylan/chitin deacetylase (PgdA/CDA1 family)
VPARIALTFEAGGEAAPAPAILAALDSADARATFFLDGRWAEANEALVRSIAERGHELGNHGYRHPDWTTMSSAEIEADLTATEHVAERLTGRSVKPWARPPYGAVDERVLGVLRDAGYHAVYRDAVDGAHWPGETTTATVRERALRSAHDGGVIVFHTNRAETPEALPAVIDGLRDAGFRPGTLSELDAIPTPRLERHADFSDLDFRPGYVRPARPGRWQSIPVLELAAAATQPGNTIEPLATLADASLELITGDAVEPVDWRADDDDRYVLVLAGDVSCELRRGDEELGLLIARAGELFLCPASAEAQLGPADGRRWIALAWRTEDRWPRRT